MSMNSQGRPTGGSPQLRPRRPSGSSLLPDEPLLFEIGDTEHSGVDLPEPRDSTPLLGGFERKRARPPRPHRARGDAPLCAPVPLNY